MGDGDDGFAFGGKRGEQSVIEIVAELRVLPGSPFVEHINRAVFQHGADEGKAFFLAGGEIERGEAAIHILHLALKPHQFKQMAHPLRIYLRQPIQAVEQMRIIKDGRKQIAMLANVHELPIQPNLPGISFV